MRNLASALFVIIVAACGGGGGAKPAPQTPAPDVTATPTCADAARRGTEIIANDAEPAPTDDQRARLQAGLEAACTEDGWSAELVACITNATQDGSGQCEGMLTEDQQEGLGQRLGPLMIELGQAGRRDDAPPPPGAPAPDRAYDPCEGGE